MMNKTSHYKYIAILLGLMAGLILCSIILISLSIVPFDFNFPYKEIGFDSSIKFGLAFVPALFSIAYPFIIQTISQLNEKYSSVLVIEYFQKEKWHTKFKWSLWVSMSILFLTIFDNNFIYFLCIVSQVSLLVCSYFYFNLIFKYINPTSLFDHITQNLRSYFTPNQRSYFTLNKEKEIDNQIDLTWNIVSDLLEHSLINHNTRLYDDILYKYIFPVVDFIKEVKNKDEEYLRFDSRIYNSSKTFIFKYKNSEIFQISNFSWKLFYPNNFSGQNQFIDRRSFEVLWWHLIILSKNRPDLLVSYWKYAHQYFSQYSAPTMKFDGDYKETSASRSRREAYQRKVASYKQFHTALGGLVLYQGRHDIILKFWSHTQSIPERFPLLLSLDEIMDNIMLFRRGNSPYFTPQIIVNYYFNGLDSEELYNFNPNYINDSCGYIRLYLALLFLRLWKMGRGRLTYPRTPTMRSEMSDLKRELDSFKNDLKTIFRQKELVEILGLSKQKKEFREILKFISNYQKQLENVDQETLESDEIVASEIEKFDMAILDGIKGAYNQITSVIMSETLSFEKAPYFTFSGIPFALSREIFIKNQKISYIGLESACSNQVKSHYLSNILSLLSENIKASYIVLFQNVLSSIEKLQLDENEHIIIAVGGNRELLSDNQVVSVSENKYLFRGISIFYITESLDYDYGYQSELFILRKQDFPRILHVDTYHESTFVESTLSKKICNDLLIYRKLTEVPSENQRDPQVELRYDFKVNCYFNPESKIVRIKYGYSFQEGGNIDLLESIRPF